MKHELGRIVKWGQELLAEVVQPGDFVVDLTAGTGQDTLALYQLVGPSGQVAAFDIQAQALSVTRDRLVAAGGEVRLQQHNVQPLQHRPGIDLLQLSHSELAGVVSIAPKGIIANLGYLPGGRKEIITLPESTVKALEQSCRVLAVGGRLAVVVYPGHPGGMGEGIAVSNFFVGLQDSNFLVLQMKVSNRSQAPFLFVVEKLG